MMDNLIVKTICRGNLLLTRFSWKKRNFINFHWIEKYNYDISKFIEEIIWITISSNKLCKIVLKINIILIIILKTIFHSLYSDWIPHYLFAYFIFNHAKDCSDLSRLNTIKCLFNIRYKINRFYNWMWRWVAFYFLNFNYFYYFYT